MWLKPFPSHWSCAAISSFASLPTNQSSSTTSNQNVWFQPIKTVLFGPIKRNVRIYGPYLHRKGPMSNQWQTISLLCPTGVYCWRLLLAWAVSLQLLHLGHFTWRQFLSSPHPRLGLWLVLNLWQQSLVNIKWWYLKWHPTLSPDTTLKPMHQHLHKHLELSYFPWWYWKVSDESSKIDNLPHFQLRSQRLYSV